MNRPPERIWLQTPQSNDDPRATFPWTWADHEIDGCDTEYVRADLVASLRYEEPLWTETEEAQALYLIASMTGRSKEDVSQPVLDLLHSLRYSPHADAQGMVVTDLDTWEGEDGG